MARRFSLGFVDGPLGTAQDFSTPAASSRKSQCIAVASCCWITKRGAPRRPRRRRPAAPYPEDDLAQGESHRQLVHARVPDVTAQGEEHCSGGVFGPEGAEPLRALAK